MNRFLCEGTNGTVYFSVEHNETVLCILRWGEHGDRDASYDRRGGSTCCTNFFVFLTFQVDLIELVSPFRRNRNSRATIWSTWNNSKAQMTRVNVSFSFIIFFLHLRAQAYVCVCACERVFVYVWLQRKIMWFARVRCVFSVSIDLILNKVLSRNYWFCWTIFHRDLDQIAVDQWKTILLQYSSLPVHILNHFVGWWQD